MLIVIGSREHSKRIWSAAEAIYNAVSDADDGLVNDTQRIKRFLSEIENCYNSVIIDWYSKFNGQIEVIVRVCEDSLKIRE